MPAPTTPSETGIVATRVTSSRLIGRTRELAELEAALADAASGRPSLAFIAGESGVGKTRLLKELEGRAAEAGGHVIGGECVALGDDELPYAPIVAALRPLSRDGDPVLDELGPMTRAGLASLMPELARPDAPFAGDADDPAQGRVFEALLTLLNLLGRDEPVLLSIEDIHWADASTRAFLVFLARSLRAERVLVVASYRPDELHRRHPLRRLLAELERGQRARHIDLTPLSRDELAQQLSDILGAPADDALISRLYARSEGNPFFAEELLAAGLDGRGELPPTMRDALIMRIEGLSPPAQDVVRLLAVARRLDHALLTDASSLDAATLRDAVREAVAGHVVVVDSDGRYRFRHALLREVVHDDLLPGEHAELHLALARAFERRLATDGPGAQITAGIAHHYLAAGDQPAALAAAVRAAEAAEAIHAHGEAARLFERALELWPRVGDAEALAGRRHWELLAQAAQAHDNDGHRVRAEALYEAALEGVDVEAHPHRAAGLLERLAAARWGLGTAERGLETLERGLALLPEGDASREKAMLLARRAGFLMLRGRHRNAIAAAREALPVADAAGEPGARSRALNALGASLMALGEIDEGAANLREALALAAESDRSRELESAYVNLADHLHQAGRSEEARAIVIEGRQSGDGRGDCFDWLELLEAEIAFDTGHWAYAADHMLTLRPYAGTTFINATLRRAELAIGRGDADTARALLEQTKDATRYVDEPQFLGVLGALLAELERRAGDLDAARTAIQGALDRIETCTDDVVRLARVATVGTVVEADAAQRGRDVGSVEAERIALMEAEFHLARVSAAADNGGPIESAWLRSAEAEYERAAGRPDPARHEAAAAAWDELHRPYSGALMRYRAGEGHIAAGDREAATAVLDRAHAVASELGAAWLLGEIEGLAARARLALAACAPPDDAEAAPRREEDDPFGLTPRERQVLVLVAEGRTNREIGDRLFMAEKTASVHVSRILSKLDVRSRTEAAAVAHRLGLDGQVAGPAR
jgi:DNA-binding CsgD family transcriptional regulator/tetratricopeptide (TPR) repeat protein